VTEGSGRTPGGGPGDDPAGKYRIGDRIEGRYLVIDRVGEAATGLRLHARDERLQRVVAIKLLLPLADGSGNARRRFERDTRALTQLDHPNILPILDFGVDGERPFIVSDPASGRSLADIVAAGRPAEREALSLIRSVFSGLEHAHSRGVLHREINPQNVFTDASGQVLLAGFGVAHPVSQPRVREEGAVVGASLYLAPESLAGEHSEQSDLYAVGAVLYELLFGEALFSARTSAELIAKINSEVPGRVETPRRALGDRTVALLRALLAKDPADRPRSAAQANVAVEAALAGGPGAPTAVQNSGGSSPGIDRMPSSTNSLSRSARRLWADGTQPSLPWVSEDGREPAVRARGAHDALDYIDSNRPDVAQAVRAAIPADSLAVIEGTPRTGWIAAEHDRFLPGAVVSVMGAEGAFAHFRSFLPSQLEGPILGRLVTGIARLVGRDPSRLLKMVPRGWAAMFRDMGEVAVTDRSETHAVIEMSDVPAGVADWEPYALSWGAFFDGVVLFCGHDGTCTWAIDSRARVIRFELRWGEA
jgi:serine/threonine protein kinase